MANILSAVFNQDKRTIIDNHENSDSYIFYDALVKLGFEFQNQTKRPVRVVGYKIASNICGN
ncbi:MAG: hypothetical protein HUK40_19175 [Desulfobacter sp.]|nr:hypothetical protein [Desulfobacter sp.]